MRLSELVILWSWMYVVHANAIWPTPRVHSYTGRYLSNATCSCCHKGIRYNEVGSDETYAGDLLNLIIAKLTDDLVGLLIERDAVARTVVEIHGTTLGSPPVRICRVTFEVSWWTTCLFGRIRQHSVLCLRRAPMHGLQTEEDSVNLTGHSIEREIGDPLDLLLLILLFSVEKNLFRIDKTIFEQSSRKKCSQDSYKLAYTSR